MKDNSDIDYKRRTHYIIIALLGIAVLWLNYCSLRAHVSSNSRLITDYQPKEDELARYRNPAVAGIFYSADKDRLDSEVEHYLADTASPLDYQPRILIQRRLKLTAVCKNMPPKSKTLFCSGRLTVLLLGERRSLRPISLPPRWEPFRLTGS